MACAQARAAGRPELWKEARGEWGQRACERASSRREGGGGGREPRRRRRARAFRGRRIRACARRRSVRVGESDACAFTCARESGKSVGRLEGEWGVERRAGGGVGRRRLRSAPRRSCVYVRV